MKWGFLVFYLFFLCFLVYNIEFISLIKVFCSRFQEKFESVSKFMLSAWLFFNEAFLICECRIFHGKEKDVRAFYPNVFVIYLFQPNLVKHQLNILIILLSTFCLALHKMHKRLLWYILHSFRISTLNENP